MGVLEDEDELLELEGIEVVVVGFIDAEEDELLELDGIAVVVEVAELLVGTVEDEEDELLELEDIDLVRVLIAEDELLEEEEALGDGDFQHLANVIIPNTKIAATTFVPFEGLIRLYIFTKDDRITKAVNPAPTAPAAVLAKATFAPIPAKAESPITATFCAFEHSFFFILPFSNTLYEKGLKTLIVEKSINTLYLLIQRKIINNSLY